MSVSVLKAHYFVWIYSLCICTISDFIFQMFSFGFMCVKQTLERNFFPLVFLNVIKTGFHMPSEA